MSIQAVAWVLRQQLPTGPKLVLIAIANHANQIEGYCFLRADTIAREASCSVRSVYRCVGALIRNGYLRKSQRKGDDGKQRANDYWILCARPPAEWDWGKDPESEHKTDDLEGGADIAEPQDVEQPDDNESSGENAVPSDSEAPRERRAVHVLSSGPGDSRVTRIESDEPSESNPKDARESVECKAPRRGYRPPLPVPQGAVVADKQAKRIFVFKGTSAWEAWVAFKSKERRGHWNLSTWTPIDKGVRREGWWFPSLFPPPVPGACQRSSELTTTDPPTEVEATVKAV